MDIQQKRRLDRILGTPLAWGTNLGARLLGALLGRDHSIDHAAIRHIVVQKIVGMGSIIQATPMLAALRASFPNATITLLTAQGNRALVERLPLIDRGLYLNDNGISGLGLTSFRAARALMRDEIDLFFDLELYSAAAAVLSAASCARNRYGFYLRSARFKSGSYTHLAKFTTHQPVWRVYLQLALAAGAHEPPTDDLGPLLVRQEDHQRLAATLRAAGTQLPDAYIAVNPNASDLRVERRWPAERFAILLERLVREGHRCILIGGPGERAYVGSLVDRLSADDRGSIIDTSGRLTVGEMLAVIDGARCVVTNDSGPMHVAFALRRPTVCLWGPGDPRQYGSDRPNVATLYHPVFCSPCVYEDAPPPCGGNNICMQLIEPAEVLAAVHRLLDDGAAATPADHPSRYTDFEGRALGLVARVSLPPSRRAELSNRPDAPPQEPPEK